MPTRRLEVPAGLAGERADKALAAMAGVSRSLARRLLEDGAATIDGAPLSPRRAVAAAQVVIVEVPAQAAALAPEEVPFAVRYEDAHLAVVDKPAGIVVHPGAGRGPGTLAGGILQRWPQVRGVGEEGRWGIVHRLDRDTSGLLVVALTADAWAALRRAIAGHLVERAYWALVHGEPAAATGTIDAPLGRHPRRRGLVQVDAAGRSARTHYQCLARWPAARLTLLEVTLDTGRTHQIRVHLASIGHPVVGDPVYGREDSLAARQFLHATRLRFAHPITGEPVVVESPLPLDLVEVLGRLGEPAPGDAA
ncbi:MAG TPA: RluA family pseudouridine synthase [Acidimicrobiia bacterium]|nr:RluA family pseudouridine synthase [Acidimicrobiia bacterium]